MIAIANHLWQSTLFALAAGVLTFFLRKNSASVRHAVWLAASVKFLIPFSLLSAAGARLSWLAGPQVTPRLASVIGQIPHPLRIPVTPFTVSSSVAVAPVPANAIPIVLAALWICGAAAVGLGRFSRLRQVRRFMKESVALCEGSEYGLLCRALRARGMSPLPLITSSASMEPGVCGIIRSVLVLPTDISTRLLDSELDAILAHELAHVRRRDNLTAAIHAIAETLFWFHPLVWWIGARMLRERERACDQETLSAGCDPQTYAEGILKVCQFYVTAPADFVAGVTGSNLKVRIEEIMINRRVFPLGFGKRLLLATAAVTAIGLPVLAGLIRTPVVRAQAPVAVTAAVESVVRLASIPVAPHAQRGAPLAPSSQQTAQPQAPTTSPTTPAIVPTEWLSEVTPLITDAERAAFQKLGSDEERNVFIMNFWISRDPTPGTPANEFKDDFYRRVEYVNTHFAAGVPGSQTDRGRMYILNGPPDEIVSHPSGGTYYRPAQDGGRVTNTFPFETWRYQHLAGKGDNMVYEFVARVKTGEYTLEYDPAAKDTLDSVGPPKR